MEIYQPLGDSLRRFPSVPSVPSATGSCFRGWFWVMSEIFSTGEDKKRSVQCRDPKKNTTVGFLTVFDGWVCTAWFYRDFRKP